MQREGDLPLHRHLPDRALLRRLDPVLGDAVRPRGLDDHGVIRVEENAELGVVEVGLVGRVRRFLDLVGVIEHHAEIADAADAGLGTHRRVAAFDPGIAQRALLGFSGRPVVIHLLVGTTGDAHPPAAALLLVDQHDAVFLALVDRARGAGGGAGRVQAMLAETGEIHHEGVLVFPVDLLLHALEIVVLRPFRELTPENLLPVWSFFDLLNPLTGDLRARPRGREGLHLGGRLQVVVVEVERLVVVVDLRQVGVGEDVGEDAPLRALLGLELAGLRPLPAAVPARLVLPVGGISGSGLGFDVVEPGVFDAVARGPDVLAGDGAGVAPDAFVEVQHHADLCTNSHSAASFAVASRSSQSTFFIFLTTTNSSRFAPTVP